MSFSLKTCLFYRSWLLPSLRRHSPLKDRISKFTSTLPVSDPQSRTNCIKYRNWTEISMRAALDAVLKQGMSVSKASVVYGVPRSTINDHIHGRVLPGARSGAPTLLSTREEQELVEFLCRCADIGYAKTRHEVLDIVTRMLAQKGIERAVTKGWWTKFMGRHQDVLSLRTPATLSLARASASSKKSIDNYFDMLEQILNETGLCGYPGLIYNMDESGFPLDPKPLRTVNCRGSKNPLCVSSGSKSQVSIAACVSASGQSLPPYIIWKRKTMPPVMATGELPGTEYGLSEKGWMNSTLFNAWFRKIFLRYAPASRPILLLLDGHSSHYCPDTIQLASENEVIMFTLPPNTTHITQPLDKGVFGPFKAHWKLVCHDYLVSHPGQVINPYNFVELFSKAWIESMTPSNIAAGFEITGIYPINREAVRLPGTPTVQDKVVPNFTFTPFKRYAGSEHMFTSSDLFHNGSLKFDLPLPPKSLRNVENLPTPKLKTVPLSTLSDRIISSHSSVGLKDEHGKKQAPKAGKKCKPSCYLLASIINVSQYFSLKYVYII